MRKKIVGYLVVLLLCFVLFSDFQTGHAAQKTKISQKTLTLTVGKSKKISLKNTKKKKKVRWSSSKRSVATVSRKGKVTAKKAGVAVIKAKLGKRSYYCRVKVKKAAIKKKVKNQMESRYITLRTGNQEFRIKLYDNKTAEAFLKLLPLTITMDELNGNEKYFFMDKNLPSAEQSVDSIKNGDFMLFGSDCIVLFYKDFKSSYNYTKIGYIEDNEGFQRALGSGKVQVSFRRE